ncbi:MAG: CoB--CoM heterodisulfide reductase iron-sulfur subunit B family protein [bacterium]
MDRSYALFLGCTIPARARNYELSVRALARHFNITLVDVEEFSCCGFPLASADHKVAQSLAARNLSIAEQKALDICTLCSSCTSSLTETSHELQNHPEQLQEINKRLSRVKHSYHGPVRVRHFVRILWEEVGLESIKASVKTPLEGLRLAAHYGCHFLKPSEVYGGFDPVEDPRVLDELIRACGATPVDYARKKQCCGGSVLVADEHTALAIGRDKLAELKDLQVDALVVVCPFCGVMFDSQQKKIEKTFEETYEIPVLYLTQVLGLAMGMDEKDLGLSSHAVKTRSVLEKVKSQAAL